LQYENNGGLKIHTFDKVSAATKALFQLEKDHPQDNVVLVQADTFEQIRSAYRAGRAKAENIYSHRVFRLLTQSSPNLGGAIFSEVA